MTILMKILLFNYITFLVLSIIFVMPLLLIFTGIIGTYMSIVENKDLSYKRFIEAREEAYR